MRLFSCVLMLSLFVCLLTGCWDAKEIQSINYATALGVDYVNDKYVAYLQLVDFATVAKTEGGNPEKVSVWVGKGEGVTLNEAVLQIYESSQEMVFWGNVTAIIFSERAIKKGFKSVIDLTNRYREFRYTKWVYGTDFPIEEILTVTPFKKSPLETIMHEPKQTYRQSSNIHSIKMNRFIAQFHEPVTTIIPRLSITENNWTEIDKPIKMLYLSGGYLIDNRSYKGKLNEVQMLGLRWLKEDAIRNTFTIHIGDKPVATLIATKPKHTIHWELNNGKLEFQININVRFAVNELLQDVKEKEIEKLAAQYIEQEIRNSYKIGLEHGADPLKLGYAVFKKRPSVWRDYWEGNKSPLSEGSLYSVEVQAYLQNSGKYKLKY